MKGRRYKIGLSGTHSTGKTSFFNELTKIFQDKGYSVGHVANIATQAKDVGFRILRDHGWESTLWVITKGISAELEEELRNDIVLVDRAVPDALAYLRAALEVREEKLENWQTQMLEELVQNHTRTYDVLIKTIIDESLGIEDDNRRDTDPFFRQLVDQKLHDIYVDLGIQRWSLTTENSSSALKIITEMISFEIC